MNAETSWVHDIAATVHYSGSFCPINWPNTVFSLQFVSNTPCPVKKEASRFSTISLVFLDRFS